MIYYKKWDNKSPSEPMVRNLDFKYCFTYKIPIHFAYRPKNLFVS